MYTCFFIFFFLVVSILFALNLFRSTPKKKKNKTTTTIMSTVSDMTDLSEADNRSSSYPPTCVSDSECALDTESSRASSLSTPSTNDNNSNNTNDSDESSVYERIDTNKSHRKWRYKRIRTNQPRKQQHRRHKGIISAGKYISTLIKYSNWNLNANKRLRHKTILYLWPSKPANVILTKHQREICTLIKSNCHKKIKLMILKRYKFKVVKLRSDSKTTITQPSHDRHFAQMYVHYNWFYLVSFF